VVFDIKSIREQIIIKIIALLEFLFCILFFILLLKLGVFQYGDDFDSILFMLLEAFFIVASISIFLLQNWGRIIHFITFPLFIFVIYRMIMWMNMPDLELASLIPLIFLILLSPMFSLYIFLLWYLNRNKIKQLFT
jgi:hypothetical protein